jgi:hypothetical protein
MESRAEASTAVSDALTLADLFDRAAGAPSKATPLQAAKKRRDGTKRGHPCSVVRLADMRVRPLEDQPICPETLSTMPLS